MMFNDEEAPSGVGLTVRSSTFQNCSLNEPASPTAAGGLNAVRSCLHASAAAGAGTEIGELILIHTQCHGE
jgi:hypothetical protein